MLHRENDRLGPENTLAQPGARSCGGLSCACSHVVATCIVYTGNLILIVTGTCSALVTIKCYSDKTAVNVASFCWVNVEKGGKNSCHVTTLGMSLP